MDQLGLRVGDTLKFGSFTPEQIAGELGPDPRPAGRDYTFHIVGLVRRPLDLGGRGDTGGVIVPTRAFYERHGDRIGSFAGTLIRVRTRHGTADVNGVVDAARRIFGDSPVFSATGLGIEGQGAQNAVDVTTIGLWILAGVAAVAGLVAIALALARFLAPAAVDDDALRALGVRRGQRWLAATATVLPIAIGGAVVAVVAAALASPLFPIGVARDAEPDLGVHVDGLTLGLGFLAVVVVVSAVGALAAFTVTARRVPGTSRPGAPTAALTHAGMPPTISTGAGFALEHGRERTGVPVRSALAGAVAGVLGVVTVLTFASSLDRLASTPRLYGWTWDYATGIPDANTVPCRPVETALSHDPVVGSIATLCDGSIDVDGHPVGVLALIPFKGEPIGLEIVEGRAPTGPHDIVLGKDALDAIGKDIGDSVRVGAAKGSERFRIVGRTVTPTLQDAASLADGAAMSASALRRIGADNDGNLVLRLAPGVDRARATRHLASISHAYTPISPTAPAEIDRLDQVDFLAPVLGGFVALVALLAIGYTLVVGVRRRRRDLAILKTIGFDRRQVRATVAWQASTLSLVGVVVGIPLGIVVGRLFWGAVADDLGVSTSISVPVWAVAALVPVTILLANLVAAFPARSAARTSPALALRAE